MRNILKNKLYLFCLHKPAYYSILKMMTKEGCVMSDILEGLAGTKMLHLKQDIIYLRKTISECDDEERKKLLRRELMDKETYYNILADRQRVNF